MLNLVKVSCIVDVAGGEYDMNFNINQISCIGRLKYKRFDGSTVEYREVFLSNGRSYDVLSKDCDILFKISDKNKMK